MAVDFHTLESYLTEIVETSPEIDRAVVRADIVSQQVSNGMSRLYMKSAFRVDDEPHQFNAYLGDDPPKPNTPDPREAGEAMIQRIKSATGSVGIQLKRGSFS